jgi:hypothetical protein
MHFSLVLMISPILFFIVSPMHWLAIYECDLWTGFAAHDRPLIPDRPDISAFTDDILTPVNSYRWLWVIHRLATRTLSPDHEPEQAKLTFVCRAYRDAIVKIGPSVGSGASF